MGEDDKNAQESVVSKMEKKYFLRRIKLQNFGILTNCAISHFYTKYHFFQHID